MKDHVTILIITHSNAQNSIQVLTGLYYRALVLKFFIIQATSCNITQILLLVVIYNGCNHDYLKTQEAAEYK